jgi:hypothetical protein
MSPRRVDIVFDLTPDMTFRLTDGTTVSLGELECMVRLAPVTGYAPRAPGSRIAKRVNSSLWPFRTAFGKTPLADANSDRQTAFGDEGVASC